jgi:hypothetical protein
MTTSQFTPSTVTRGDDLLWQELYILNSNGTFTKSRDRSGVISEATGSFVFKDISGEKYLELTYETGISLISSCTPGKEILRIRSESIMQGTWAACDGEALEYERIK